MGFNSAFKGLKVKRRKPKKMWEENNNKIGGENGM